LLPSFQSSVASIAAAIETPHGERAHASCGGLIVVAMTAYQEAISPLTVEKRKEEIGGQLLAYCWLDSYALLRLWQFFVGRQDLAL
jgi:hypothetical protein